MQPMHSCIARLVMYLMLHADPKLVHLSEVGQQEVKGIMDVAPAIALVLGAGVGQDGLGALQV